MAGRLAEHRLAKVEAGFGGFKQRSPRIDPTVLVEAINTAQPERAATACLRSASAARRTTWTSCRRPLLAEALVPWLPPAPTVAGPGGAAHGCSTVAVEVSEARLLAAWLVPSEDFAARAGTPNSKGRLRFYASLKAGSRDKWRDYRLEPAELAPRVLVRLDELANGT